MSTRLKGSLAALLEARERGWVRVATITWHKATMVLDLAIDSRRNGVTRESWRVECRNVQEYKVSDVNGGGLAIYDQDHPAVRHHVDDVVGLRFHGKTKQLSRVIGDLVRAHDDAAGDWIAFDSYLGPVESLVSKLTSGTGTLATGPKFLLASYAVALRQNAIKPRLLNINKRKRGRAMALHFGNSFVVALSIRAERV